MINYKKKVDIFIITNIPSFYKIRLYNEMAKIGNIFVFFIDNSATDRTSDFYDNKIKFDYQIGSKNRIWKIINILYHLNKIEYKKLTIAGWDSFYYWLAAFISKKRKNRVVVESTYFESHINGLRAILKKIFLSRIASALVPGQGAEKLMAILNYKGEIKYSYGVGLYRRVMPPVYEKRDIVRRFLYVGRLAPEKNLEFLIHQFNKLPNLTLTVIGYGPLELKLKKISNGNILFLGEIKNKDLALHYRNTDVFVLPSISESWGLVVEEALNNGVPVIVNNTVGCIGDIVINGWNGIVYDNTETGFVKSIRHITTPENYNRMRINVCSFDYENREKMQINANL